MTWFITKTHKAKQQTSIQNSILEIKKSYKTYMNGLAQNYNRKKAINYIEPVLMSLKA